MDREQVKFGSLSKSLSLTSLLNPIHPPTNSFYLFTRILPLPIGFFLMSPDLRSHKDKDQLTKIKEFTQMNYPFWFII
ncbi:hypothetical protein [Leptospira levettii]|uniref:hypothetical protein n=1 Tax=Leptospira levettii TaxID=2023178 RepID=UPI000CC7B9F8|nr:hypothetical protein [Leptospira levettii]MCW7473863.1 hypothetical protein [Leptospira levettii]PJZ89292.1 hypothetical protein CH368_07315 [Leptospira levettii]